MNQTATDARRHRHDAHSFLSEEDASYRAMHVDLAMLRPHGDDAWQGVLLTLLATFGLAYPALRFTLDWDSSDMNARTWPPSGLRADVVLYGGIARHKSLGEAGLAIVVAHEVAHHVASGASPSSLSCEPLADYEATRTVMPAVLGSGASATATAGIAELEAFWATGPDNEWQGGSTGCTHPPVACRASILRAGAAGQPIPICRPTVLALPTQLTVKSARCGS